MKIGCRWHPPWLILDPQSSLSRCRNSNKLAIFLGCCPIPTLNLSRRLSPSPNSSRHLHPPSKQTTPAMAKGWPFIGGLLIVTTITYLNITTITVVAKDIQTKLLQERRRLENARNSQISGSSDTSTTNPSTSVGSLAKWPSPTRVTDRVKKMWNDDIERSVRRLQKTDWERMGRNVGQHVKRARERMATSFERMGEDSKKKSA